MRRLRTNNEFKLRVANAVNNPFYGPDPTLGIVNFDSWQIHECRVAIMRNALESGVEEQRERKNKSKVTQKLVEKKKREIFKNYKQEKKRVTYTNEERRETAR